MKAPEFSKAVLNVVKEKQCSYLEAIAEACQSTGTEYEKVKPLLTPVIMEHLTAEAQFENLIPKTATLPMI